jgi:hypothetical protein
LFPCFFQQPKCTNGYPYIQAALQKFEKEDPAFLGRVCL